MSGAMLHAFGDCTPQLHCGCLNVPDPIDAAIRDYHTARKRLLDVVLEACPRHLPLDQADGRPLWCKRCGRTTFGELVGEVGK